ncbi:MAG: hypothetical protein ACUVUC_16825 [Thermoguttaceae bacterium]
MLGRFWRSVATLAGGLLGWAAASGWAWAQAPGGQAAESEHGAPPWVLPYALVILCVGLGVYGVIHPSRRRERAKPEVYGKPK